MYLRDVPPTGKEGSQGIYSSHPASHWLAGALGISIPPSLPAGPHKERGRRWKLSAGEPRDGAVTDSLCCCRVREGSLLHPNTVGGCSHSTCSGALASGTLPFCTTGRHMPLATAGDLEFAHPPSTCHIKCVYSGIICYLSAVQQPCMKNNIKEQIKWSVCKQPV